MSPQFFLGFLPPQQRERQHPGWTRSAGDILAQAPGWGQALHASHLSASQTPLFQAYYKWGYLFPVSFMPLLVDSGGWQWNALGGNAWRITMWRHKHLAKNWWVGDLALHGLQGGHWRDQGTVSWSRPSFCVQVREGCKEKSRFR